MSREMEIDRHARLRSTLVKAGRAERASDSLRASLLAVAAASAATAATTPAAVAAASSSETIAVAKTGATRVVTSTIPAASGSTASLAASASGVVGWKVLAMLLAIGVVGTGATFYAWRESGPVPPASAAVEVPSPPTPVAPQATVAEIPTPQEVASISVDELPTVKPPPVRSAPIAAPTVPRAPVADVPPTTPPSPAARLTEETRAVGAVRTSLQRGDTREALRLLDGYDAEFPRGVLAEEAEVLRIETLIRAGNESEASSRANRFLAERPQSPHAARVRTMTRRLSEPR